MGCRYFGLSTFWFFDVLVCRRFGLSTFRSVDVLACRRFGLSTFWFVDVLACRRFGLSTFRFVDVSVCRRFGCRRFGLSTFWPVTWYTTASCSFVCFALTYTPFPADPKSNQSKLKVTEGYSICTWSRTNDLCCSPSPLREDQTFTIKKNFVLWIVRNYVVLMIICLICT